LGSENDTIDATVNLTGNFYDIRDSLIYYTLYHYDFALPINVQIVTPGPHDYYYPLDIFSFDQDGKYSTNLLARNTYVNKIDYLFVGNAPEGLYSNNEILSCEDFSFFKEPGETMLQDIHLTDWFFLVGTNDFAAKTEQDISILCAPNPVTGSGKFMITSENPLEKAEILVCSSNGTVILKMEVPNSVKSIISFNRDGLGMPGLYFFTLLQNNQPVKSGEFICL
jgi:hypothetical protein